jgi:predicted amidophosphoribosyltransferase
MTQSLWSQLVNTYGEEPVCANCGKPLVAGEDVFTKPCYGHSNRTKRYCLGCKKKLGLWR